MEASGYLGFEHQSSQSRLLHPSPLDALVRRTSSGRRKAAGKKIHNDEANANIIPSCLQPRYEPSPPAYASPPRPFAGERCVPDIPLLHANFRSSTASAATNITTLHANQNSKSFLSFTDDCEQDDGRYEENIYGQLPHPATRSASRNYYPRSPDPVVPSTSATHLESHTNLWALATGLAQPTTLNYTDLEDLMPPPPSPLPTVVVSSPQDDDPTPNGPMRQPTVSQAGSPRLNFSRPGRPPILSSEEEKRRVLERNARRANSPVTNTSPASLSPVTPVTGILYPNEPRKPAHVAPHESPPVSLSYLHPDGVYPSPSTASSSQITLLSRLPSLRPRSSSSVYSDSYSFYQLDSASPSPSQTHRYSPDVSPASSRPASAEPQTPEEYLQLGIQYHEANKLKDSAVYFEKSATEQGGCGVGMLMWGLTLRHGWGCEKNEKSGFKWLTKAAEAAVEDLERAKKGFAAKGVREELVLAIYEVGQCFFQGWGVAKDQKMAVSYYRVAANFGDSDAQQDLAFCLANGKGCKKDKKEAAKWYRAAVAQGVSDVGMAWIHKDKYKD